jgi:NAD(P)-dependent dehydrogenase (short-subunit alcohol dehydrogenase family)
MKNYADKKIVVVGGTHGMGLAIARAVHDAGGRVLVTGRNPENVETARTTLGERQVVQSDVTDLAAIATLGETVQRQLGRIDAAFVNVGIAELAPFAAIDEAAYDRLFAVNTRGAFFAAQRLAPLVRDGGAIVFTTVTNGTTSANMSLYMGTKGALRALSRGMATELVARNVRVNTVAPGFIDTPTLGIASATAEERAEMHRIGDRVTPMKRHGTADEVARAALFLAFEATFTTGIELPVDGGLSAVEAPL